MGGMAKELEKHSMIVSRGNDLCVSKRVTQADEFLPSGRSDAYSLA